MGESGQGGRRLQPTLKQGRVHPVHVAAMHATTWQPLLQYKGTRECFIKLLSFQVILPESSQVIYRSIYLFSAAERITLQTCWQSLTGKSSLNSLIYKSKSSLNDFIQTK